MIKQDVHPENIVDARIEHWQYCIDNFNEDAKNSKINNLKVLHSMLSYWKKYKLKHYGK